MIIWKIRKNISIMYRQFIISIDTTFFASPTDRINFKTVFRDDTFLIDSLTSLCVFLPLGGEFYNDFKQ